MRSILSALPLSLAAALLLAFAIVVAAPASAGKESGAMLAKNGYFDPEVIEIEAGGRVTWTNADDRAHTVTSSWDQGATFNAVLGAGEHFSYTFNETGTFPIHCVPHAYRDSETGPYTGMVGTVHVLPLAQDPALESPVVGPALAAFALGAVALVTARVARRQR